MIHTSSDPQPHPTSVRKYFLDDLYKVFNFFFVIIVDQHMKKSL